MALSRRDRERGLVKVWQLTWALFPARAARSRGETAYIWLCGLPDELSEAVEATTAGHGLQIREIGLLQRREGFLHLVVCAEGRDPWTTTVGLQAETAQSERKDT